ncbi:cytochrome P450 [Mycena rosella]|uniref:Cytochrome P450 n=1 Tax=Mycena rosella TaxID=1033263 RepID=A0AAD7CYI2_MYCRO|nr:cytochrome P450 [Mycena rosella]
MSADCWGSSVRTFLPVFVDVAKKNPEHPLAVSHLNVLSVLSAGSRIQQATIPFIRASAFLRSKATLVGEWFTAYIPDFILRLALCLSFGLMPALLSFNTVTVSLMQEKGKGFDKKSDGEKRDLLGIIRALAQNPEFQQDLRQEILATNLNLEDSESDYDNMPLLNLFLKETLRLFPPGPLLERWASEDCVLPLSSPLRSSQPPASKPAAPRSKRPIHFSGGGSISAALWGPDAAEFKPSRWLEGDPRRSDHTHNCLYIYLLYWFNELTLRRLAFLGGNHAFGDAVSLPKDSVVRAKVSATQFPVDSEGVKGLWLDISRCVE